MDAKHTQEMRRRLSSEYETLIKAIDRNRLAVDAIRIENTEDEGDLATISREREILYNLNESDFVRLRSIEEAMKAMDRGNYGECARCGRDINEKRLAAVPWATMCIFCQQEAEADHAPLAMVMAAGLEEESEL